MRGGLHLELSYLRLLAFVHIPLKKILQDLIYIYIHLFLKTATMCPFEGEWEARKIHTVRLCTKNKSFIHS